MSTWSTLEYRSKTQRVYSLDLVHHETLRDLQAERGASNKLAYFGSGRRRNPWLGAIHIADERGDPTDVIHEAIHAASRYVKVICRKSINEKAEEHLAQCLQELLPKLLEEYGYKLVPIQQKEESTKEVQDGQG